jgi:hypothetical protein
MKKVKLYRDSVTGQYVTKDYADANPDTTQSETVKVDEAQIEEVEETSQTEDQEIPEVLGGKTGE